MFYNMFCVAVASTLGTLDSTLFDLVKKYNTDKKHVNHGIRWSMEKASWRAGKTATMYELVPKSQDMKEKCVVGTNQDATSTRKWRYPRLQNQIKIK